MGEACSTYVGRGELSTWFWWACLREKPLGRPRRRGEDNIKMDLQDVGWGGIEWIDLA